MILTTKIKTETMVITIIPATAPAIQQELQQQWNVKHQEHTPG